ncbi:MAG: low-specificity L-threonine aldolase [Anaerolineales bacterium]|jgi:threonine aldolase
MQAIDLRSDTVTLPTAEMRRAMAEAEVGDDVYGEDPTVNQLEREAATRMGKQAAVFVPSGTMGNLAAVLSHCGRGDEVILGNLSHTYLFEAGGVSVLGGVHTYIVPNQPDGTLDLADIAAAIRSDDAHFPISRLLVLENTHNRCGGVPLTVEYTSRASQLAHSRGLKVHLDGARIFNASAALGVSVKDLVAPVDSVTFCLSKALSAPVGSVLCGSEAFIHKARRMRKILGGGMRQAGILAAAGLEALKDMPDALREDHRRAKVLADGLHAIVGLTVEPYPPPSNMVFLNLEPEVDLSASEVADKLQQQDIRIGVVAERRFRLVTHRWIDDQAVQDVITAFDAVIQA